MERNPNEGHKSDAWKPQEKKGRLVLIIKVTEPNYVPEGIAVRSRIDPYFFTGEAPAEAVKQLEKDNAVESFSINRHLPLIN